jgi:diaminopimelate epimerase
MIIPFTKAHGARNDFLLTWAFEAPHKGHEEIATAICDRHTGVGADGWMLVQPPTEEAHASIRLYNSDGSQAEISGNGTRCAAAFLVSMGYLQREVPIMTGAGLKHLRLLEREENRFVFEMNMGQPLVIQLHQEIEGRDATILDVGNPQCAFFVDHFDFDWAAFGAVIERHPYFPNRTNVSFIRPVDRATLDVRFFERGAGVTMSSGTGSTGAAAAARARGLAGDRVKVQTPAGPLDLQWEGETAHLVGPAEIVVRGEFYH